MRYNIVSNIIGMILRYIGIVLLIPVLTDVIFFQYKKNIESIVQVFEILGENQWKRDRFIGYVSSYIELRIQK